MHKHFICSLFIFFYFIQTGLSQTVNNKLFSFGGYGRVGVGFAPAIKGSLGRSLNLNGMGSIGGRMEEQDYLEMIAALHFTPAIDEKKTNINIQTRLALYTTQGQFLGNVTSKSFGGITFSLPEIYAEVTNIMGSNWSAWIGARLWRSNDIHIADYFYFDDHSSTGFGVTWKKTSFTVLFPGSVDTTSSLPPYFYLNIVNGTPTLGLRQRTLLIGEQQFKLNDKNMLKILAEYHQLADATLDDQTTPFNYPADNGWVLGAKHIIDLNTTLPGSFNQFSVRYGQGIANGGDGGGTKTWLTYGAPNLVTNKFSEANSITFVEHFLLNMSNKFSINGYGIYTKSRGASDSLNTSPDYLGRQVFNRKTDFAVGVRTFVYLTDWFHLMNEVAFASRKDGNQDAAQMVKFGIIPTLVPTAKRDPWARPHFRLVYTIAKYNEFAKNNLYSPYLQQIGNKSWGHYIGVKAEWWLY
ncbi:carbohydrate porin [Solitalea canadensis]|uniref:Maltoporin (Phage lambda and maltose receptor) n=1 Tax=Solitalea canadensis (strain ATCC 29591 / DSM 3403 / JCM 21819 / LMG 8368 / NBRC 15130 / NCIMB 12057 / USAM 9D) TaxID=929556 RepID=H8KTJ5_SOLCM|nr:carbohydrate porin [Solitalea canadensis]AFD06453.1 maltoporin (phage lambda and maltose receptor) [Solitalea canadensis DSM 3403]